MTDLDHPEVPIGIIMLVKHDPRNFWRDDLGISIGIFDSGLNPKPTFDRYDGSIENGAVSIVVTH